MGSLRVLAATLLTVSVALAQPVQAQDRDAIQRALASNFQLATMTSDKADLTAAGTVLVLQRDKVVMNLAVSAVPMGNVYKNGRVQMDGLMAAVVVTGVNGVSHSFVAGDKFFVTGIDMRSDAVSLQLMSDLLPVPGAADARFHCSLKIPFPKGSGTDDVLARVSEVVKIDSPPPAQADAPQSAAGAPPTISKGMSRDQVIAAFGVPVKVARIGAKEIDTFPDMKVTFVNGKVADVQ